MSVSWRSATSVLLNLTVVLLIGAILILPEYVVPVEDIVIDRDMLTVEETLALSSYPHHPDGGFYHLYKKANPDALNTIRNLLEARETRFMARSFMPLALGYLGDEEDVPLLRRLLDEYEGKLSIGDQQYVNIIIDALAVMCGRGVPGAEDELLKFCSAEYWWELPIELYIPGWIRDYDQHRYYHEKYRGAVHSIRAYGVFGEGDWKPLRDMLLAEVEDEGVRNLIRRELSESSIQSEIAKRRSAAQKKFSGIDKGRLESGIKGLQRRGILEE